MRTELDNIYERQQRTVIRTAFYMEKEGGSFFGSADLYGGYLRGCFSNVNGCFLVLLSHHIVFHHF